MSYSTTIFDINNGVVSRVTQEHPQTQRNTNNTLLFRSTIRPRAPPTIDYNEITKLFNNQVYHETNSLSFTSFDSIGQEYKPIFGYDRLIGLESYSRQKYSPVQLENRLTLLSKAVADWDLIAIQKLLDNAEFDDYLEIVRESEDPEEKQRRIIKRMILEQISSIVQPLRHERDINEKELNLVILLNSL